MSKQNTPPNVMGKKTVTLKDKMHIERFADPDPRDETRKTGT
jgi:hypothetical protein